MNIIRLIPLAFSHATGYMYNILSDYIMSQDTFMCTVVSSGDFFHQFTFCAIIPSHQIVGTYQYKRTCMSTCISGESLQPEIFRIDCNHPSRWSVGWGLQVFHERHPIHLLLIWSRKPIQTWTNWIKKHHTPPPPQICTYDND